MTNRVGHRARRMGQPVVTAYSVPRSVLPVNENQEAGRRIDLIVGMRVGFHRRNAPAAERHWPIGGPTMMMLPLSAEDSHSRSAHFRFSHGEFWRWFLFEPVFGSFLFLPRFREHARTCAETQGVEADEAGGVGLASPKTRQGAIRPVRAATCGCVSETGSKLNDQCGAAPANLSCFHKPSSTLPSGYIILPAPSILPSLNSPTYFRPSGQVYVAWPFALPSLNSPTYFVHLAM